ncbi:MAG: NAD-dependent epimerase/dehydratase family protein [Myxococcales bacterium FL481]|nr:MAG: NAD-dependent epimerase/dehydratase family protein [Myxococcales bacterium FL481]
MCERYYRATDELELGASRIAVTGAAGFVGSHLVSNLLQRGRAVVGIDNFSTGKRDNLEDVRREVGPEAWARFRFIEGSIEDPETLTKAFAATELVFHQAALTSVARSWKEPVRAISTNVLGFVNVLTSAQRCGVRRIVYASSSSVYGETPTLPKRESTIGQPISPYAATKLSNEAIAQTLADTHPLCLTGLRYFNVFGPRQNANGPYAAVIPRWIAAQLAGEPCHIFGDGTASRDFTYIDNIVQANLLAAAAEAGEVRSRVFNVGTGQRTQVREVLRLLQQALATRGVMAPDSSRAPVHEPTRPGDVLHSLADLSLAHDVLGYDPQVDLVAGLERTVAWYAARPREAAAPPNLRPAA